MNGRVVCFRNYHDRKKKIIKEWTTKNGPTAAAAAADLARSAAAAAAATGASRATFNHLLPPPPQFFVFVFRVSSVGHGLSVPPDDRVWAQRGDAGGRAEECRRLLPVRGRSSEPPPPPRGLRCCVPRGSREPVRATHDSGRGLLGHAAHSADGEAEAKE